MLGDAALEIIGHACVQSSGEATQHVDVIIVLVHRRGRKDPRFLRAAATRGNDRRERFGQFLSTAVSSHRLVGSGPYTAFWRGLFVQA
jgi:hypothetical protein